YEHTLLRFGEQDLVRRHARLTRGHERQIDLHPHAAFRGHLGGRGCEPGRAHVLDGDDVARRDQGETGLEQQLLGERVAHLDLGAPLLALVRQLFGRERRAVDAVAPRARADHEEYVAYAPRRRLDEIPLLEHADAHRVHERIPAVTRTEVHLAPEPPD